MMASEVWFLRAEGILKGWNTGTGTARKFYENGIATSMGQWGITDAGAIAAYTASMKTPVAVRGAVDSPAFGEGQTNATGVATGVAKLGGADNEATRLWWNK